MLELNDNNFLDTVKEGKHMLMFSAQWCQFCPPVTDILTELEKAKEGGFKFSKMNFDLCPKAVAHYGIFGVPIVLAIEDGLVLKGWAGLTDAEVYREFVDEML